MKLSDRVKLWVEETGRTCDGSLEAVGWMSAYGSDHLRAWEECPRGDWLVLMAAALGADEQKVFDVACEASRAAVAVLPSVIDWPRGAGRWNGRAPLREFRRPISKTRID
jgi:hypothetical protein